MWIAPTFMGTLINLILKKILLTGSNSENLVCHSSKKAEDVKYVRMLIKDSI
jgi:hypothetical protein